MIVLYNDFHPQFVSDCQTTCFFRFFCPIQTLKYFRARFGGSAVCWLARKTLARGATFPSRATTTSGPSRLQQDRQRESNGNEPFLSVLCFWLLEADEVLLYVHTVRYVGGILPSNSGSTYVLTYQLPSACCSVCSRLLSARFR